MSKSAFVLVCALLAAGWQRTLTAADALSGRERFTRVTTNRTIVPQARKAYTFPSVGITFDTEFDGARVGDVTRVDERSFTLSIEPENHPINDSAWYAFRVRAETNTTVDLTLSYRHGPHRYSPVLSDDRIHWRAVQPKPLRNTNGLVSFSVELGPKALFVAAQELITSKDMDLWIAGLGDKSFVKTRVIGQSVQGRPLRVLEISETTEKADLVFLLGRQHPPEVTGTMALQAFVSTLCAENPEAVAFRKRFRTIVFPLINPDGVDGGHWRHNARGADLNRDWGQFNQPETRAVSAEIRRIAKGARVRFGIDFHSTREDVFYTSAALGLDDDAGIRWLERLQELAPDYHVRVEGSVPARGRPTYSSAPWIRGTYNVPAITYEVGDRTDRDLIRRIGQSSACAMMQVLTEQTPGPRVVRNEGLAGAKLSEPISVALFDGPGVSGAGPGRIVSHFKGSRQVIVRKISALEIQTGSLTNHDIIIFPGGSANAQAKAIGEPGKSAVRDHVRSGGGYIGICAGAYLACSGFPWAVQVLDAKTVSPKWQRGDGMVRLQLTPEGLPILRGPTGPVTVKYQNGPILMPAGDPEIDDYVSLALFRTEVAEHDSPKGIMIGSPASVAGTFGKGRVICFSPHPEQTVGLERMVEGAIRWAARRRTQ